MAFDALGPVFLQRALAEVLLLAAIAALVGTQVVLRRLSFFAHGVAVATFPGLVLAGLLAIPAQAAALGSGAAFAGALQGIRRRAGIDYDAATALALVASLAVGVILASDVLEAGSEVDRLLFGSLVGISQSDLVLTTAIAAILALLSRAASRTWTLDAFESDGARRRRGGDLLLLGAVAAAVVATADAAGALLVGALLITPAATALLLAPSVRALRLGTLALAAAEGVAGVYLAYALDVPPGPAIAVLGGLVFAAVALGRAAWGGAR